MLYNQDWERQSNPVSDILLKAADLLEKHGLAKFQRMDINGSMCFLGAVQAAQFGISDQIKYGGDSDLTLEVSEAVASLLKLRKGHAPDTRQAVADWNNHPERTSQQVIDAMRQAAHAVMKETADVV